MNQFDYLDCLAETTKNRLQPDDYQDKMTKLEDALWDPNSSLDSLLDICTTKVTS